MKAMIFAAGLGTRLAPLTNTMPKAMVPISGKPMIQHQIVKLRGFGVYYIVVNVHHFAEQIIDFVKNNDFGVQIEISDEKLEQMNIDSVVEWLDKLQKIDTTGVEPMLNPAEHDLPLRADVVTDGGIRDAVLANAPDKAGVSRGYFAVPKVMEGD